jgi:hypothetical protein
MRGGFVDIENHVICNLNTKTGIFDDGKEGCFDEEGMFLVLQTSGLWHPACVDSSSTGGC